MYTPQEASPRFEALIKGQGELLQMITQGKPLHVILESLVRWIESQGEDGLLASVLLADPAGEYLHHGSAPSLPPTYNAAIDGIRIGPGVGSCGTAAYTQKAVIVENIATDPLWKDFRELALQHQLQSCWSTPLIGSDGKVKGTFAIYYRQPRRPSSHDLAMITLVSQIALMAIEFRQTEEERRKRAEQDKLIYQQLLESESNFRNLIMKAPVGICIVRAGTLVVETVNDAFLELVGKTRSEFENRPYWDTLKAAEPYYGPVLKQVIETGLSHVGKEAEVTLIRKGKEEQVYISFVYDPIKEVEGRVEQVMILGIEVSEQVRARKEVEQSEQQVRSLVESAPFPIGVYVGKEMQIKLANQSIIDIWGKGPDVIGKLYAEILPELSNQHIFQQLDQVYETGVPFHAKNQRVDLMVEGQLKTFYFNYSFTPVFNSEGKVYAVMNTAADVTELNVAHQQIRESEKNLRNIITQAPVAMCILQGPDHVVEIANERMFELWGRPESQLLGKPLFEGLPEVAGQGFEALLHRVYTTGETYTAFGVPVSVPRAEGVRTVYINFVYEAFRKGDASIAGVMAVATDVTEQVLATKKIEEAEERARLAVESAELGTFLVNLATNESITSGRMAEIFNLEPNADRAAYVSAIYPEDRIIRDQAYKRAWETGILDYEGRVLWKDGSLHWVRVKGRILKDEAHQSERLLGVVQDITEQKTFAETLAQQVRERTLELELKNRELERSNTNLEEFAHAASHDLKEPIRKIRFFTDRLRVQLQEKAEEADIRLLERIETASARMSALIEDLLRYSHVSHRLPEKEEIDLEEMIRKVLEDLEVEIDQRAAMIHVGPLPRVPGYPRQLQQLFQNLIGNALKYQKAGVAPVISIAARQLKGSETGLPLMALENELDYCLIEIQDNGIGFEQHLADKIFQMFQRLHGRNEYSGTGVGLAIVKKVVENHGGKIVAISAPGEGATFRVYLPL